MSRSNNRGNKPYTKITNKGRNQSNKGNRNKPKTESQQSRAEFEGREETPINNSAWYVASESTKQAVERISFNNILGMPYAIDRWTGNGGETQNHVDTTLKNPLFATIQINPSIEPTKGLNKTNLNAMALNRMCNITYVMLSAMSGRTQQYTAADIGFEILAIGSIQALISHIRRAIGISRYYSQRNMSYPLDVLKAMHITTGAVSERKLLDFTDKLNYEIRLFNAVKFPKNLPYFEKMNSLFDNVYKDSEGSYSQDFAFIPYSLWKLNETYNEQGSGLDTVLIGGAANNLDIAQLINILDDMITELTTSTTQALIGSDLLNYANKKGLELGAIPELDYDYTIAPVYSAEACIHFHHARPIGAPVNATLMAEPTTINNDVKTSSYGNAATLFLTYAPAFESSLGSRIRPIIDIDTDNPNLDEIVEARRFTAYLTTHTRATNDQYYLNSREGYLTDTYVVKIEIFGTASNGGTDSWVTMSQSGNYLTTTSTAAVPTILSAFNHAPIIPYINTDGSIKLFDQVANIASLDDAYLSNVNHLEQLDLFTIREMKQYVTD